MRYDAANRDWPKSAATGLAAFSIFLSGLPSASHAQSVVQVRPITATSGLPMAEASAATAPVPIDLSDFSGPLVDASLPVSPTPAPSPPAPSPAHDDGLWTNLDDPSASDSAWTTEGESSAPQDSRLSLPPAPRSGFERAGSPLWPSSPFSALDVGVIFSATYDSNLHMGQQQVAGADSDVDEDDFIFSFAPFIRYRTTGGGDWHFDVGAGLDYSEYINHSDYSGWGYRGNVGAGYQNQKFSFNSSLSYSFDRGNNQYFANSFVEQHNIAARLAAAYEISPKTVIDTSFSYSWSEPDGEEASFDQTDSLSASLAAMWKPTPLLRIGPGVAYSHSGGNSHSDRETIGPVLRADYRLGAKLHLNASVGVDFVTYDGEDAGSDDAVSAMLGLDYRASALWGMNLSFHHDTMPDGYAHGGYRESTGTRVGYHRSIRRASLNLGVAYETTETSGASSGNINGEQDYLSADASLSMPLIRRLSGSVFFRWKDQNGDIDADGYQTGVSLSASF